MCTTEMKWKHTYFYGNNLVVTVIVCITRRNCYRLVRDNNRELIILQSPHVMKNIALTVDHRKIYCDGMKMLTIILVPDIRGNLQKNIPDNFWT